MRLSERQQSAMKRLRAQPTGREHLSPDLAKQLARKNLVRLTGNKYTRVEWNRKVKGSTLWEVQIL